MAGKVALGSLWHAFSTPSNQRILGQTCIRILDLDKCKLNAPIRELFYEVKELTLCRLLAVTAFNADTYSLTTCTLYFQDTFLGARILESTC